MLYTALILRDLGLMMYGGPIIAFTILIATARFHQTVSLPDVIRTYRRFGVGLGLSLGATIFGMLVAYYLEHGAFRWGWQTPTEQVTLAAWLTFLVMWISNIRLEIWTLDPLRMLDVEGIITNETEYRASARVLLSHLFVHSGLIVLAMVLFNIARIMTPG